MSDESALVIRSRRVVLPDGVRAAALEIRDGRIATIALWDAFTANVRLHDAGDCVVMPGLVDTHVHVNEPGRTEWEGFRAATDAAAAGGVTTLLDMPLNSIPATTTVDALRVKRLAARGQCRVNVEFLGGVVPGNAPELEPLVRDGVRAFKCFLVPSGVEEFPAVNESDLRLALPVLASLDVPLMVHAELPEHIRAVTGDPRSYASYLESRPDDAETSAVSLVADLAAEYGTRIHIVHVSSGSTIGALRAARERGIRISAETCPHYLTFDAAEIPDGATEYKCAPPIRDAATRERLWQGLVDGDLDMIVSDHSPCPPALKQLESGDFAAAWGGIASLQLGLSAVWEGARQHGLGVEWVAERMCAAPARLVGLSERKGSIRVGHDADLVVWDPEASFVVSAASLRHRHKITPYLGRTLHGVVKETFVNGRLSSRTSAASVGI